MEKQTRNPKRRYKLLKYCIIAGIALSVIIPILVRHTITECDNLLQTQNIPIPSDAVETETSYDSTYRDDEYIIWLSLLGNRSELQREVLSYEVEANYEDILAFYEQFSTCKSFEENTMCRASIELGEYFVHLDNTNTMPSKIVIDIWWNSCPTSIFD